MTDMQWQYRLQEHCTGEDLIILKTGQLKWPLLHCQPGKPLYSFSFPLCAPSMRCSKFSWMKQRKKQTVILLSILGPRMLNMLHFWYRFWSPRVQALTACVIINHSSGRNRGKDLSLKPNHLGSHSGTSKQKGWWLEQGTYLLRLSFLTYKMCKESQVLFRRTVMGILKALEKCLSFHTLCNCLRGGQGGLSLLQNGQEIWGSFKIWKLTYLVLWYASSSHNVSKITLVSRKAGSIKLPKYL